MLYFLLFVHVVLCDCIGENEWKKVRNDWLPMKEASSLQKRFIQLMTSDDDAVFRRLKVFMIVQLWQLCVVLCYVDAFDICVWAVMANGHM